MSPRSIYATPTRCKLECSGELVLAMFSLSGKVMGAEASINVRPMAPMASVVLPDSLVVFGVI